MRPEHLIVRYEKHRITFTDGQGHEFQPKLTEALEVIRVMSEYALSLASDLAQREHSARSLVGQQGVTGHLRDVAARRGSSSDPWALGDQKFLVQMAEHGEELQVKAQARRK